MLRKSKRGVDVMPGDVLGLSISREGSAGSGMRRASARKTSRGVSAIGSVVGRCGKHHGLVAELPFRRRRCPICGTERSSPSEMRRDTITKSALPHNARNASSTSMVIRRGCAYLPDLLTCSTSACASGRANDVVTSASGMSLASALSLAAATPECLRDLPVRARSDRGLVSHAQASEVQPPARSARSTRAVRLDPCSSRAAAIATPPIRNTASSVAHSSEARASLVPTDAAVDASTRARTPAADRGAVHGGIHRSSVLSAATIATATSAPYGAGSSRRSIRSSPRAARSRGCSGPRHTSARSGRARDPAAMP